MTLNELETIEKACTPPLHMCPCCDGVGEHGKGCTFAEDCPGESEMLDAEWAQCSQLYTLFAWARGVLQAQEGKHA